MSHKKGFATKLSLEGSYDMISVYAVPTLAGRRIAFINLPRFYPQGFQKIFPEAHVELLKGADETAASLQEFDVVFTGDVALARTLMETPSAPRVHLVAAPSERENFRDLLLADKGAFWDDSAFAEWIENP